jgi:hypothetical protein
MAAPVTLDPQEPMLQQAALQVVIELLTNECWQVTARTFDDPDEAWVVLGHSGIQRRLFRTMPAIGGS